MNNEIEWREWDLQGCMIQHNQRWETIHVILINHWDAIGVGEYLGAQDEYDSYIPGIERLLAGGADLYKLTQHLSQIAEVSMGLYPNEERDAKAATFLLSLNGAI